ERVFGQVALHRRVYYVVRAEFKLPAQLAARAIAKVVDAYKAGKAKQVEFRATGAVIYDSRVLRLVNLSTVSLTTLRGRITVGLAVGDYQRRRLSGAVLGETELLFTPEKNSFSLAFSVKSDVPLAAAPADFLGVDMGVRNVAVDSDGTFYTGGHL